MIQVCSYTRAVWRLWSPTRGDSHRLRSQIIETRKARFVRQWAEFIFENSVDNELAIASSTATRADPCRNLRIRLASELASENK
jgi:hypothetical protein